MRHRKSGRRLNRTSSNRKAMFYNMSKDIIKYERIKTTLTKAKELRIYLEPLVTLAKVDNLANRKRAFSVLRCKKLVHKLFTVLGMRYTSRPGGYVRILKYKYRAGDASVIAIVEFVNDA